MAKSPYPHPLQSTVINKADSPRFRRPESNDADDDAPLAHPGHKLSPEQLQEAVEYSAQLCLLLNRLRELAETTQGMNHAELLRHAAALQLIKYDAYPENIVTVGRVKIDILTSEANISIGSVGAGQPQFFSRRLTAEEADAVAWGVHDRHFVTIE